MKHKVVFFTLVLGWVVGILIFSPIDRGPSAADPGLVAEVQPSVFLVEMEDEVCASQSQIHTTSSFTSAEANTDEDEALPTVFLVMLEDGICASLSPISTTSRIAPEADRTKEKSIEQSDAVDSEQVALGAEMGVWYVQR